MKQINRKFALVLLLGALLMNPHPVNAAVSDRILAFLAPFTGFAQASAAPEEPAFSNSLAASGEREPRYTTVRWITAYSSTVDQCDDTPFITANGTYVHDGVIAANWLKFGTKVKIPEYFGDKVFTVADRMNPRFDDRMDIWMAERADAVKFGIRKLTVEVL